MRRVAAVLVVLAGCSAFGSDPGAPTPDPLADAGTDAEASASGDDASLPGCQPPGCTPNATGVSGVVTDVVTSDTEVLFMARPGGIYACPLAGCSGPPRQVVAIQSPRFLATHAGFVFWFDGDAGEVRGVSLAGGAPFTVLQAAAKAVVVGGSSGLWIAQGYYLTRCPFGAADAATCTPTVTAYEPVAAASDGAWVYWVTQGGDVYFVDVGSWIVGGPLDSHVAEPLAVFAEADYFYLLRTEGTVVRYSRKSAIPDGGVVTILLSIAAGKGLTVTADTVYVTGNGGQVVSAPAAGGPTKVVASGLSSPGPIAARGDALYVGVAGGVVRIARPAP